MRKLLCALPLLLTGCLGDDSLDTFKVIDSMGGINYAVVAKSDVHKRKALYNAAKEVCDQMIARSPIPPTCYVLFWTDVSQMPSGIALSEEHMRSQVASYTHKPGSPDEFYLMKDGVAQ